LIPSPKKALTAIEKGV